MKSFGLGALALLMAATPALADVKAGVDAWSRGDFTAAVKEWRGPATAGDTDAQFNLGQAYKLGRGVPTDLAMARSWYAKAAAQGHHQAQDNLGLALFQDGQKTEALPWLEKSAARDEKRAELVLGTMLFNGDGVPKDWTRAYALVTRSSQQGLDQGSRTIAQMDGYIPAEQRQQGLVLARQIEAQARAAAIVPPNAIQTAQLPPSQATGTTYTPPGKPTVTTTAPVPPRVVPPRVVQPPPAKPRPAPVATAAPTSASGGRWRVQLGAFRDAGNARDQWAKVGPRLPGASVSYVKAGSVTRVLAGGFASKAEASHACAKARVSCVVVAP